MLNPALKRQKTSKRVDSIFRACNVATPTYCPCDTKLCRNHLINFISKREWSDNYPNMPNRFTSDVREQTSSTHMSFNFLIS